MKNAPSKIRAATDRLWCAAAMKVLNVDQAGELFSEYRKLIDDKEYRAKFYAFIEREGDELKEAENA